MAYSTIDDVKAACPYDTLVALTDDGAIGEINAAIVANAIAMADAEIDAYASKRYSVPLGDAAQPGSVPEVIRRLSAELAVYYLHGRVVASMPPAQGELRQRASQVLLAIAEGTVSISAATDAQGQTYGAETNESAQGRTFNRSALEGF